MTYLTTTANIDTAVQQHLEIMRGASIPASHAVDYRNNDDCQRPLPLQTCIEIAYHINQSCTFALGRDDIEDIQDGSCIAWDLLSAVDHLASIAYTGTSTVPGDPDEQAELKNAFHVQLDCQTRVLLDFGTSPSYVPDENFNRNYPLQHLWEAFGIDTSCANINKLAFFGVKHVQQLVESKNGLDKKIRRVVKKEISPDYLARQKLHSQVSGLMFQCNNPMMDVRDDDRLIDCVIAGEWLLDHGYKPTQYFAAPDNSGNDDAACNYPIPIYTDPTTFGRTVANIFARYGDARRARLREIASHALMSEKLLTAVINGQTPLFFSQMVRLNMAMHDAFCRQQHFIPFKIFHDNATFTTRQVVVTPLQIHKPVITRRSCQQGYA
jgi:hypothetical protein